MEQEERQRHHMWTNTDWEQGAHHRVRQLGGQQVDSSRETLQFERSTHTDPTNPLARWQHRQE